MNAITNLLGACTSLSKQKTKSLDEEYASEVQLNAFEFRNYHTNLEPNQQQVLERVVNSWCTMLVKGKTMRVEGMSETVYLDKDLLSLEIGQDFYPLKSIHKIEFFKDGDDLTVEANYPYGANFTFEAAMGDVSMSFNFEQERSRLHFVLTMRILRTRDPTVDPESNVIVDLRDEDEDEEPVTFNRIVNQQHYNIENGIPIVFSVSDLKLFQKLQTNSMHVYLEFFVKYPSQERFLYAKSPTTHLAQQALKAEPNLARRKKEHQDELAEAEEKKEELKRQVLGDEVPLCSMRFDLKNVKLKLPKVPHHIFGRLTCRDDYFPTAIGTFDFQVNKTHLLNKLTDERERKKAAKVTKELPETLRIPVYSAAKDPSKKEDCYQKIGTLTLRLMGYVVDPVRRDGRAPSATPSVSPTSPTSAKTEEDGDDASAAGDSPASPVADSRGGSKKSKSPASSPSSSPRKQQAKQDTKEEESSDGSSSSSSSSSD